jgi:hypothetical protein
LVANPDNRRAGAEIALSRFLEGQAFNGSLQVFAGLMAKSLFFLPGFPSPAFFLLFYRNSP